MRYERHEYLVGPARPTKGLPRVLAGVALTIVTFMVFGYVVMSMLRTFLSPDVYYAISDDLVFSTTPLATLINLFYFALLIIALSITLRRLHNRGLSSIIGDWPVAWFQFWQVTRVLVMLSFVVVAATSLLPAPEAFDASLNMGFGTWLALLPLTLIGLLIQTSAEELAFRGYLQSQLAAQFQSPLIWIGVPSLFFALLHHDPEVMGGSSWMIVIWAAAFGAAAADLTARAGTLGPAIALHLVNNTHAIALSAPEGNFDGLALYSYPFKLEDADALLAWMPVEMVALLCTWLAARLALRL